MADKKKAKQPEKQSSAAERYNEIVGFMNQATDEQIKLFLTDPEYADTRKTVFATVLERANETSDYSVLNAITEGLPAGPLKNQLNSIIDPEKYAASQRETAAKRMQEQKVTAEGLKTNLSKWVKNADGKYVRAADFVQRDATPESNAEQRTRDWTMLSQGVDNADFIGGFRNAVGKKIVNINEDEIITASKPAQSNVNQVFKEKFEAIYPDGFQTMDPHEIARKVAVMGGESVIEGQNGELLNLMTGKPYQPPVLPAPPPAAMPYSVPMESKDPLAKQPQPAPNMTSATTGQPVNAQAAAQQRAAQAMTPGNAAAEAARKKLQNLPMNFMNTLQSGQAAQAQAGATAPPASGAVDQFVAADQ